MAEAKVKQAPRIDGQTTIEEMTKYWKELYNSTKQKSSNNTKEDGS
jgi:hypothetical protein